ncbi:MAG: WS/DGAT domain-containing protein [Burkholderiales bacterium]
MKLVHKSKRMTSVDKAWLRMDTPNNLMVINVAMVFDKHLDIETVKNMLEDRLLPLDRFSQRVHFGIVGATWRPDPEFDLDRHLGQISLPPGAGTAELQELIALRAKRPLPLDKPLWHIDIVHNYEHGSVLIFRLHHCIADGIAVMDLLVNLTDPEPGSAPLAEKEKEKPGSRLTLGKIVKFGISLIHESAILLFMPNDSRTRFKGQPDIDKQASWGEPVPLSTVKALGRVYGATINDVMLSVAAGALRKYLQMHGDQVDGRFVRAFVPVNLRPKDQDYMLGNEFGLVAVDLPLSLEDPIERLVAVNRTMSRIKRSAQAQLSKGILGIGGRMPHFIQNFMFNLFSNRSSVVITNVTGPESVRYMAGAKMKQLIGWVPQSGDEGIGICILSYQGTIQLGLLADKKLVPDAGAMMKMFRPAFDELCSQINPRPVPIPGAEGSFAPTDVDVHVASKAVGEN